MPSLHCFLFLLLSILVTATVIEAVAPPGYDQTVGGDFQVYYGDAVKPIAAKDGQCMPYVNKLTSKSATYTLAMAPSACLFYAEPTCSDKQKRYRKPFQINRRKEPIKVPTDFSPQAFICYDISDFV